MRKTTFLALIAFVAICSLAPAKKFWDPPAGQGTSTVGTGGDYATLLAAAADYNTSNTTGAWTIEIISNLTEASNTAFSRANSTYPVTIKPAASITPTVVFTKTTDNAGPTGHIVVGSTNTAWAPVTCNNFTIDGSNNGTNSRDLTFTCAAGAGGRLINVTGNSANFVVKNINVNATTLSSYCITFTIRNTTGVNYAPIDPIVDNVYMNTQAPQPVAVTSSGTIGAYAPRNVKTVTVRNCSLWGRDRGIFLNYGGSANIYNNTIRLDGTSATDCVGVYCYINNDATATNTQFNIYNNTFKIVAPRNAGANGDSGIRVDIPSYLTAYNNIIYLEETGAAGSLTGWCRGFYLRAWEANAKIYNNSINIYSANQYYLTGGVNPVTPGQVAGICVYRDNYQGTFIGKNNLIRVDHKGGGCIDLDYQTNATGTGTADNNDYYAASGCSIGQKGTGTIATPAYTPYATLSAWQAATGLDANSQDNDPSTVWVSTTDLHFNGAPGTAWKFGADVSAIFYLATDIDGGNRDVVEPYVGADEPVAPDTTITVASPYGSPSPAVGVSNTTSGTLINASVASPVSGGAGIQYVCTGYTGTGSAPSGSGNSVSFTITTAATLTWTWKTQYTLTTTSVPAGGGTVTPATGWQDASAVVSVGTSVNAPYVFTEWTGALTGSTNPDNVTMDAPKSVTANFSAPTINLPEVVHNFGSMLVTSAGGSTADKAFEVQNNGIPSLTLNVYRLSGSADFTVQSAPASVAGNSTDTITIRYTPDTVGPVSAIFNVISNDPTATTSTLTVSGTGINLTAVVASPVLGLRTPASAPTMNDAGAARDAVSGDGIYTLSADLVNTPTVWKVLKNKNLGWGGGNDVGRQADGGDMPDAATTGTVLYYYDVRNLTASGWLPATEGLGSSALSNIPWAAVGAFSGWNPDTAPAMHDDGLAGDAAAGDGIFTYQFVQSGGQVTDSPWKVVSQLNAGWTSEYKFGANGMSQDSNDSSNATYSAKDGQFVTMEYDAWMGHIRSTVSRAPTSVDDWRMF